MKKFLNLIWKTLVELGERRYKYVQSTGYQSWY